MIFDKGKNTFVTPLSLIEFLFTCSQVLNDNLIDIVQVKLSWLTINLLRIFYCNFSLMIELNFDWNNFCPFEIPFMFFLLTLENYILVFSFMSELNILLHMSWTLLHITWHNSSALSTDDKFLRFRLFLWSFE